MRTLKGAGLVLAALLVLGFTATSALATPATILLLGTTEESVLLESQVSKTVTFETASGIEVQCS
jgi:hypothetical protein